jgi:hypothetical protein
MERALGRDEGDPPAVRVQVDRERLHLVDRFNAFHVRGTLRENRIAPAGVQGIRAADSACAALENRVSPTVLMT